MEITFSDEQDDPLPTQGLAELAAVAMEAESLPSSTQLSITLVCPERMAELNSRFMAKASYLGLRMVRRFYLEIF